MLCLSGFELYSRWVPLRKILEVGSSILALYVVCIRFTCKGSSLSLLAEGQEDHDTSKILALLAQCKPGADYRLLCKLISLERFFVLFVFSRYVIHVLVLPRHDQLSSYLRSKVFNSLCIPKNKVVLVVVVFGCKSQYQTGPSSGGNL